MFEEAVAELMDLDDDALTERFRTLELERRRAAAEMAAITREAERRALHTVDGHRTMRHWIRAQINCSMAEATRLRRLAVACDEIAELGDVLLDGHIGVAQADELARLASHPRVGDQFPAVAELLTRHAEQLSYEEFRVVARRWEVLADLDGADRDDEVSHERRTASVMVHGGAVEVVARGGTALRGAEMLAIFDRFVSAEFEADVAARTAEFGPDAPASLLPRTDAQRRFDALAAIFEAAATAAVDGARPPSTLNLLVGLDTYERLLERHLTGVDPGLDTSALDLGVERLETMALLLAHSCDHLGCTVPADRCEVDHVAEWERDKGRTDQVNGRPRCSTHNPLKTAKGLRSRRTRDGTIVDTRPDGTPMIPVGRRLALDDASTALDRPPSGDIVGDEAVPGYRVVRIDYCRIRRASDGT